MRLDGYLDGLNRKNRISNFLNQFFINWDERVKRNVQTAVYTAMQPIFKTGLQIRNQENEQANKLEKVKQKINIYRY